MPKSSKGQRGGVVRSLLKGLDATLFFRKQRDYFIVVFAVFIYAVMFLASCPSKFGNSWGQFGGVFHGYFNSDPFQGHAKFGNMYLRIWQNVSIRRPSPRKEHLTVVNSNSGLEYVGFANINCFTAHMCMWPDLSNGIVLFRPNELIVSWFLLHDLRKEIVNGWRRWRVASIFPLWTKLPDVASNRKQSHEFVAFKRDDHIGTLNRIKRGAADFVGLDHLGELARVNTSYLDPDREKSYFHNELVSCQSFPKRFGIMVGTISFICGWWVLRCGPSDISARTAILAIIAVLGGVILALWSV
jgi:hypothetical protein